MAVRKTKKENKAGGDFAAFMANMAKDDSITDISERQDVFYKTGDRNLDRMLGGGLPAGGIFAFQGAPSGGKSLAALSVCRNLLGEDEEARVAYFDTENKISQKALQRMGLGKFIKNKHFLMLTMSNLEDMIEKIVEFAETGFFKMIVIDSIDSLTTDEQEERDIHDGSKVGGYKAKVLSEHLPRVVHVAAENDCSILFVQQIRLNPGAMYGSPEVTSGGEAIKFYVTTRIRFGANKNNDIEVDGKLDYQGATAKILKTNQGSVPKEAIGLRFYVGDNPSIQWGIDPLLSISDAALATRVFAPTTPNGHNYAACDELCDMLGIKHGELKFNGKKNLNGAIQGDEEFRDAVCKIIDEREAMSDEELGKLDSETSDNEEIVDEEDFESIE